MIAIGQLKRVAQMYPLPVASETSLRTMGERSAEELGGHLVQELRSQPLRAKTYANRCENTRGAKREANEPHRYCSRKSGS